MTFQTFPSLLEPLLYERDRYIAHTLKFVPGPVVVAVVGLGHVEGIKKAFESENLIDPEDLLTVPPPTPIGRVLFSPFLIR